MVGFDPYTVVDILSRFMSEPVGLRGARSAQVIGIHTTGLYSGSEVTFRQVPDRDGTS